jgi:hypothetical protein
MRIVGGRARAPHRSRLRQYAISLVLTDGLRVPDRPRAISRRMCTGRARWSTQQPMSGTTPTGAVAHVLHTGADTPEGTFSAAISKLDHLVALGVTAIEVTPIGDFPDRRNWATMARCPTRQTVSMADQRT